jgi:hypothetical protein
MGLDGVPELVHRQLLELVALVDGVTDAELLRPTGCEGWRVADLVVHLRFGAEGLLVGLATPDRLVGLPRPEGWSDLAYARKGTGRDPLSGEDAGRLGPRAGAYPAFA